jgi:hypothetical protein
MLEMCSQFVETTFHASEVFRVARPKKLDDRDAIAKYDEIRAPRKVATTLRGVSGPKTMTK